MRHSNNMEKTAFLDLVKKRRSVRRFLDKAVEREKIFSCIEAARLAPSAQNVQPWKFLVIDDPETKKRFSNDVFSGIYSPSKFAAQAPVLILQLACLDVITNVIGKQIQNIHFYLIDSGIAGEHIVLQATALELGTCWIGWFNIKKARKFFNIPKKYKIVNLFALGYFEKRPPKEKKRKSLEEIVSFNRFDF